MTRLLDAVVWVLERPEYVVAGLAAWILAAAALGIFIGNVIALGEDQGPEVAQ